MSNQHLFVYGTLRRGGANDLYELLARSARFVGEALYRGRLYLVDTYPGVVPSDDPTHTVKGEVYELLDADVILPELDRYEECSADFPEPHEYVRAQQKVVLTNGQETVAWVYLYNLPTDRLVEIPSGDFFKS